MQAQRRGERVRVRSPRPQRAPDPRTDPIAFNPSIIAIIHPSVAIARDRRAFPGVRARALKRRVRASHRRPHPEPHRRSRARARAHLLPLSSRRSPERALDDARVRVVARARQPQDITERRRSRGRRVVLARARRRRARARARRRRRVDRVAPSRRESVERGRSTVHCATRSDRALTMTDDDAPPALAAPSANDADATKLDVQTGARVALDGLGPIVVGVDGTMSRISNWTALSERERETALRRLAKRNNERLEALKSGERSIES